MPSAFRSENATEYGPLPTAKVCWVWNVPFPLPSRTLTLFEPKFAVTRSGLLSAFRSEITTERELVPAAKICWL